MKHLFLSLLLLASVPCAVMAQEPEEEPLRPVFASYCVEAGSAHFADTYLTPLRYGGWQTTLRYDRLQAMKFAPRQWVMQLDFAATAARTVNPVGNATMWYWGVDFSWGMMRRLWCGGRFSLMGGGDLDLNLGALYSSRNGNNPVAVKAAMTIGLTARLGWRGKIGRLPLTVTWQPSLPVTGAFFSPEYGELYYEIYLGDRKNLARAAWWGNYFRIDNMIAADLHIGATSLRLGYRNSYLSSEASHITSRMISHCAVIGISGEWLSLNPRRPFTGKAKIISAL